MPMPVRSMRKPRKSSAPALQCAPIGCGIDVVEIDRFQRTIKRWGPAFLKRVFTPAEQAYARRHKDAIVRLAARFAAKEAVVKAMSQVEPDRPLMMSQVEIRNDRLGRPSVVLNGWVGKRFSVHVSLSHETRVAVASAIVVGK